MGKVPAHHFCHDRHYHAYCCDDLINHHHYYHITIIITITSHQSSSLPLSMFLIPDTSTSMLSSSMPSLYGQSLGEIRATLEAGLLVDVLSPLQHSHGNEKDDDDMTNHITHDTPLSSHRSHPAMASSSSSSSSSSSLTDGDVKRIRDEVTTVCFCSCTSLTQ